ncbi:DNA-binding protein [Burkholderia sp. WAC0059]|uniref:helix-turn-helix domain-containing protein n=1 Tax=Burkholderia sp. WAC0059 TaxID=2066022 RepID=UPI000C7EB748|nr:XRE family transcriptional regulator [Burkholderia sp. WAC0059]PLZ03142.1 DNA-binding protein [Burkholderia sp. WAC0059]
MDITLTLARRLRDLRNERGLSLEALAERSGVSRSNISLIERGESSPTAVVIDKLATALGVTLPELFSPLDASDTPPSPLARAADQPVWTDPESGYLRRSLSPAARSPLQLVEVHFPAGRRVAYETGPREGEIYQQIWIIEGSMEITVGETAWRLDAGDCLTMKLDCPMTYRNPTRKPAHYLVSIASLAFVPDRNGR